MMNFGRRTTPFTTDPNTGARIADPNVHGKKVGTGQDQVTVTSWPAYRAAWKKLPAGEKYDYSKEDSIVASYMMGKTDKLDDVNIEEPTYQGGKENIGRSTYSLKPTGNTYISEQQQYGLKANREKANLFLQSGMSHADWEKQPEGVKYSRNVLDTTPLAEGMKWNFPMGGTTYERYKQTPDQVFDIRYLEKPVKPVAPVKTTTTQNNVEYTEELTKPAPAPKKPTYTKEELTSMNLKTLPVGKIATQQGRIQRIKDPNEPEYKGAGMIDTRPKAQRVQQETSYNAEKRAADAVKASETGQRMEFTGGAVNKKDLGYQAKYNKQYDKFQAEKDKNPMNNKTLELFYSKRFQ